MASHRNLQRSHSILNIPVHFHLHLMLKHKWGKTSMPKPEVIENNSNYCNHKWEGYAENILFNGKFKLIGLVFEISGCPSSGWSSLDLGVFCDLLRKSIVINQCKNVHLAHFNCLRKCPGEFRTLWWIIHACHKQRVSHTCAHWINVSE